MKQKTTILAALSLAGIAGLTLARPMLAPDAGDFVAAQKPGVKESMLSLNANNAKKLRVEINFGGVEIRTAATSELTAKITKEIKGEIDTQAKKQWLENAWLKARREGDTLVIYEDPALKPKTFDGKVNLDFKVVIQVPKGLAADVSIAAGSANIQGEFDSVAATVDAGQLEIKNCAAKKSLDLSVKAGQIDTQLSQTPLDSSNLHVNVGEILFNSKGNANVAASVSMGSIEVEGEKDNDQEGFSAKRDVRLGSGGTKINLKVDTGSISIGSGKTTKKSSTKIKGEFDEKNFSAELPQDINKTIEAALRAAEIESQAALVDARRGMEQASQEMERLAPQIQREVQKALADAMKELEMAKANELDFKAEFAQAREEMKRAQAEMEREIKNQAPEMRREAHREIEKAQKEMKAAIQQALKESRKAMEEARKEMERARREAEKERSKGQK